MEQSEVMGKDMTHPTLSFDEAIRQAMRSLAEQIDRAIAEVMRQENLTLDEMRELSVIRHYASGRTELLVGDVVKAVWFETVELVIGE